jgi:hypothetical protein
MLLASPTSVSEPYQLPIHVSVAYSCHSTKQCLHIHVRYSEILSAVGQICTCHEGMIEINLHLRLIHTTDQSGPHVHLTFHDIINTKLQ